MVLADRLRDARRRRFVGRAAELDLFEGALETSPFAVLFIHGPGGVGKTALLGAFAELFAWLRALSFVDEGPHGAFPHDIARAALDADLRWRDLSRYVELHRAIRRPVVAWVQQTSGADQRRAVTDLIFLHRGNPFTTAYWDWESFGLAYPDAMRPDDREAILAMIERHEMPESRALAEHWMERQPAGFTVFRGTDEQPIGFYATLALHEASDADLAADPGAASMWEYARRNRPPRPGEEVLAGRWFMDAERYQGASASFNVLTISTTRAWFTHPRLARELIGCWADPDAIEPMMAYIDYHRAPEADYEVGGRRYGVFTHDWRQVGVEAWLDIMGSREFDADFGDRPPATAPELALSQPEFAAAARAALRDLHHPDALAANPLHRTRLARGAELIDLVEQAVAALRADPRDAKLARALERTYLRPAPTQERAAELLGLPFSTYRRHLVRGVERVVDWLWQRELYG